MATTMLRIRGDLQATSIEEQGIKYFDVHDPRSGVRMRFYDFEWLIAARMDGVRSFDELALWAQNELRLSPSAADLSEYAEKLQALGFLESRGKEEESGEFDAGPILMTAASPPPNTAFDSDPQLQYDEEVPTKPETPRFQRPTSEPLAQESIPVPPSEMGKGMADFQDLSAPTPASASLYAPQGNPRLASPSGRSRGFGRFGAIAGMVLAIAGVAYVKFLKPITATRVSVQLAVPRDVVQVYEGSAPIKKSESVQLSFGEDGKVSEVVAQGTEVKAGAALATLEASVKVERDLSDVKDRATYYERQLQAARAKNSAEEIKRAEEKVVEKQKMIADLEAHLHKLRILASSPGSVSEVLVGSGQLVKAGRPVVQLSDPRMTVEFKLPATEVTELGATVFLQKANGGAIVVGRLARREGGTVIVEVTDDGILKPGDLLRLVKAKVPNAFVLPSSALVMSGGTDAVFVVSNGKVHLKKVTVVDRSPEQVAVGAGLAAGDSVVTAGANTLTEGQRVSVQ
jgi:RND family efflux transporter MFP subunit